jgi:hypothetical protein
MMTIKKFTEKDYREAVEKAKADGHKFVAWIWDGIEFEDLTIRHVEEVRV